MGHLDTINRLKEEQRILKGEYAAYNNGRESKFQGDDRTPPSKYNEFLESWLRGYDSLS